MSVDIALCAEDLAALGRDYFTFDHVRQHVQNCGRSIVAERSGVMSEYDVGFHRALVLGSVQAGMYYCGWPPEEIAKALAEADTAFAAFTSAAMDDAIPGVVH